MCTVSWIREDQGYSLWFNRDELRTRGPERQPQRETLAGTVVLAPTDADGGGTWLAVNEFGLTLGLLNGSPGREPRASGSPGREPRAGWTSRGRLVRDLAAAADVDSVAERATRADLDAYQPFVLLALEPGRAGSLLRWDGEDLTILSAESCVPLVSSGLDAEGARRHRETLWALLVGERADPSGIEAFHASHRGAPAELPPCLHHALVETKSQCRVKVDERRIELVHLPGPPCRTRPGPPLTLDRRALPAERAH